MKLKDYIIDHEGQVVKIGMQSCFVWIGRLSKQTEKDLAKLSKKEIDDIQAKIKLYQKNLIGTYTSPLRLPVNKDFETKATRVSRLMDEHDEDYFKGEIVRMAIEAVQGRVANADTYYKNLIAKQHQLDNWKDFIDREILEIYESFEEDIEAIIICEGEEIGEYWDQDEAVSMGSIPRSQIEVQQQQCYFIKHQGSETRCDILTECICDNKLCPFYKSRNEWKYNEKFELVRI